jgi:hypothetical protein
MSIRDNIPPPKSLRRRETRDLLPTIRSIWPFSPFLEYPDEDDRPFYRVGIADRDNQPVKMDNSFRLNFYNQVNPLKRIENIKMVNKSSKTGADAGFDVYILENRFDFIEIEGKRRAIPCTGDPVAAERIGK